MAFTGSIGYPSNTYGFAAFSCKQLGGVAPLSYSSEKLSADGFISSLDEVIFVLDSEGRQLDALPVVVLLEHYFACYLQSPEQWLSARLKRISLLLSLNMFAEAAAMLAEIQSSISAISKGLYDNPILQLDVTGRSNKSEIFDSREHGFDFYGLEPFFNHLPPDHEMNIAALNWIASYPSTIKSFLEKFRVDLPMPILSPEEIAKAAEDAAGAAALAAEEAKKIKGKKGKEPESPQVVEKVAVPTAPLFSPILMVELTLVCAQYLFKIASMERKVSSTHYSVLQKNAIIANELTSLAIESLTTIYTTNPKAPETTFNTVSAANWIRLYGKCFIMRASYLLLKRCYKESRGTILIIIRRIQGGDNIPAELRCEYTQLWLVSRRMLCEISGRQARFDDQIYIATKGASDSSQVCNCYQLRQFLYLRANAHYKLGNLNSAEVDCNSILDSYQISRSKDILLSRCLMLKSSIIRARVLNQKSTSVSRVLKDCLELIREARENLEALARAVGFLGYDSNVSYERSGSAVLLNHKMPPVLYNITELHENFPKLTLAANINPKKYADISSRGSCVTRTVDKGSAVTGDYNDDTEKVKSTAMSLKRELNTLRPAPIDDEMVITQSEFSNIYFAECRALVSCHAGLCSLLNDTRMSTSVRVGQYESSLDELLDEQIIIGEEGLKLLRHVVYAPSVTRVSLLLSVGQSRAAAYKRSSKVIESQRKAEEFYTAFKKALRVAHNTGHFWHLMRAVCIELVECYGNPDLPTDVEDEYRLRNALAYLVSAIKLTIQKRKVTKHCVPLSLNPSFSITTPDDIAVLLASTSSSSLTSSPKDLSTVMAVAAQPVKGKGGPPLASSSVSTPGGRDALFMLSSILRETNSLMDDCDDYDLYTDLHLCLKKSYLDYETECCLSSLPDASVPLVVASASVSSLIYPVALPSSLAGLSSSVAQSPSENEALAKEGIFSHVACYFILGGNPPAMSEAIAAVPAKGKAQAAVSTTIEPVSDPILTKVVLPRAEVASLETTLLCIREELQDSIARKRHDVVLKTANKFAETIKAIFTLLHHAATNGTGNVNSFTNEGFLEVIEHDAESMDSSRVNGKEIVKNYVAKYTSSPDSFVSLEVNDRNLHSLCQIFSMSKEASDSISNSDVCKFLKTILGYE